MNFKFGSCNKYVPAWLPALTKQIDKTYEVLELFKALDRWDNLWGIKSWLPWVPFPEESGYKHEYLLLQFKKSWIYYYYYY
jgi:hypothetical protein